MTKLKTAYDIAAERAFDKTKTRARHRDVLSKQTRFSEEERIFNGIMRWRTYNAAMEPYGTRDTCKRDSQLHASWKKNSIWAGMVGTDAAIESTQGWRLIGGKRLVSKYQYVINNHHVGIDVHGHRKGMHAGKVAYNTQDLGWVLETSREATQANSGMDFGNLAEFAFVPSMQARLTGDPDEPIVVNGNQWFPEDYWRICRFPDQSGNQYGIGYCPTSMVLDVIELLYAVFMHDREQLGDKAPRGLLVLKGVDETNWLSAMNARRDQRTQREQTFYDSIDILTQPNMAIDIDAKLIALSNLPTDFSRTEFVEMAVRTMALALGRDVGEFWAVDGGSFGRSAEAMVQHRKAVRKSKEFALSYAEWMTDDHYGLPETLDYSIEERDDEGDLLLAQVNNAHAQFVATLAGAGIFEDPRTYQSILVDRGAIRPEYTEVEEEAQATDTEKIRTLKQRTREWAMTRPRIRRCVESPHMKDEPIVMYEWPKNREITLWNSGSEATKRHVWPVERDVRKKRATLYESDDIVITSEDVELAVTGALERTGVEMSDMLLAGAMTDEEADELA